MRRRSGGADVRVQLSLEHRPRVDEAAVLFLMRHDVGDERPLEPRRQRRREVAGLIGVRQEHERRRRLLRSALRSASTYPSAV